VLLICPLIFGVQTDDAEIDALTADDGLLHLSPTLVDTSHISGDIVQVQNFYFNIDFC